MEGEQHIIKSGKEEMGLCGTTSEDERNGAESCGDAFLELAQELRRYSVILRLQEQERKHQETLHLQEQEARCNLQTLQYLQDRESACKHQENLHLQEQEVGSNLQEFQCSQDRESACKHLEALRLQEEEAERKLQEALRLKEEEARRKQQELVHMLEQETMAVFRQVERLMRLKDDIIRALLQRLREKAMEEGDAAWEETGEERGLQGLEGHVEKMESALSASLCLVKQPRYQRASVAAATTTTTSTTTFTAPAAASLSASSAHEAPAEGVASAGGWEEAFPAPAPSSTPTSPLAGEVESKRKLVQLRMREVQLRMELARNPPSRLGEELLLATRDGRSTDVRRLITSGADVNYPDHIGCTPLFKAVYMEADKSVILFLLQNGADVNAVDCHGYSVLHWAAISGAKARRGLCVDLLAGAGADVNARDKDGETPLHWAACRNNVHAVRALLALGARRDLTPWAGLRKSKTPFAVATSPAVRVLLRL